MARSNQGGDVRKITPINNCKYIKVKFDAKKDKEALVASVYYYEPKRESYPDNESFEIAKAVYESNELDFQKALDSGLNTKINDNGAKSYALNLTANSKNGTYESISGKILNFYTLTDTFNDGKVKNIFRVDMYDEKTNERYEVDFSIAVLGRKFVDKLTSLTEEELQHNIQIAFTRFEINNQQRVAPKVYVLNADAEYGRVEKHGTYEISKWEEGSGYTATPSGSKANNKEFLAALENKIENGVDKPLIKFYKKIVEAYQKDVIIPFTTARYLELGWNLEITDYSREKKVKDSVIEEKTGEMLNLVKIGEAEPEVTSTEPEENTTGDSDDIPF